MMAMVGLAPISRAASRRQSCSSSSSGGLSRRARGGHTTCTHLGDNGVRVDEQDDLSDAHGLAFGGPGVGATACVTGHVIDGEHERPILEIGIGFGTVCAATCDTPIAVPVPVSVSVSAVRETMAVAVCLGRGGADRGASMVESRLLLLQCVDVSLEFEGELEGVVHVGGFLECADAAWGGIVGWGGDPADAVRGVERDVLVAVGIREELHAGCQGVGRAEDDVKMEKVPPWRV